MHLNACKRNKPVFACANVHAQTHACSHTYTRAPLTHTSTHTDTDAHKTTHDTPIKKPMELGKKSNQEQYMITTGYTKATERLENCKVMNI